MLGHFAASDASAARRVLGFACEQLAGRGCTLAVGPMDGSTWRNYRLVIESGSEPPFFLEPENPIEWSGYFTKNSFEPVAHYFSAVTPRIGGRQPLLDELNNRAASQHVSIRPVDSGHFEDQLRQIYAIATTTFRDNLFYTPLDESAFIGQYRALSRLVPLEFVLLAERRGEPVGFVFAVPDLLKAQRGEPMDTVIVKSLGVLPGFRNAGLGNLMLASIEQRAAELGYVRLIHALLRDLPHLRRLSARYASPMRRYALFAKVIRQ
jgi:GNAT superfamily N-acetyltransferase